VIAVIGLLVVIGSVLGGFLYGGGGLGALLVPGEYITIVGTAAGTLLASTRKSTLLGIVTKLKGVLSGTVYTEAYYVSVLRLLYETFQIARRDGLVALESHIENPEKSVLFAKYPQFLARHHAVQFVCDSLRLVLVGSVPPYDLEALMEAEIDVHHAAEDRPIQALTRMADALPAIGIVAAVLGIVVTMQSIAGPIEEIGHHVASALVGTFLGILLAYGFVQPVVGSMEAGVADETRYYMVLKAAVVAFAKGFPPIVAVEFARREIFAETRPSFQVMETACKEAMKKDKRP
jgi:chemotaxis protein MotA